MFILISLVVLAISTLLFSRVAGSLAPTKINMISWIFYFELIAQSFIASVLVVNGWDNHYIISGVRSEAKFYGWLAVQYTMIAMPLGMLLAVYLGGLKNNKLLFQLYISAPIHTTLSRRDSFIRLPLYALSGVSLLAVLYTFHSLGEIPLWTAIAGGDALSLAVARVDASLGFTGNVYVRNLLGITLTPILAYVAFGYFKQTRALRDRLWFYAMLAAAFFILTYDLSKAPVVIFALGFLFLRVLTGGGVSQRVVYWFGLLALLMLVVSYWLVGKVTDPAVLFSYNTGIGGRILLSQAAGTYYAFEHFPATREFIGFSSLSSFGTAVFGLPPSERSARIMMMIFNPVGVEEGSVAVMNSLFIAEAWANFGLLGVLIAPIYVGLFIQAVFLFFLRSKKTPVLLGVFAYLSLRLPVTGGFNDFIYSPGLVNIAFMFVSVYLVAVLLKVVTRKVRAGRLATARA